MGAQHSLRAAVMAPTVAASYFDPTPYATTVLAYYNAAAITGKTDGNAISQWDDLSGNGRHLTQATGSKQPLYKTAIFGAAPAVRCDGVDDFLAYLAGGVWHSLDTVTVYARTIRRGHTDDMGTLSLTEASAGAFDYASPDALLFGYEAGATSIADYRNGVGFASQTHPGTGTSFVRAAKFDATNHRAYLNGTGGSSESSPGAFGFVKLVVGGRIQSGAAAAPFSQIDYGAILLVAEASSDVNRAAIEAGL
jgi:hypothetical protein